MQRVTSSGCRASTPTAPRPARRSRPPVLQPAAPSRVAPHGGPASSSGVGRGLRR